jgi:hypothetical protein
MGMSDIGSKLGLGTGTPTPCDTRHFVCQLLLVSTCQCPEEADYGVIFPILDTECGASRPITHQANTKQKRK